MHAVRLIEAQYQRDKEFRDRAMRFYDALYAYLDVPEDKLRKKLMPWGDDGSFIANARDFHDDPAFKQLSVVFSPVKEGSATRASMSWSFAGWPLIRIHALIEPRNPKYLASRVVREIVVHEVIHLFDRQREKGRIRGSSEVQRTRGRAAYYNQPHEWNAYWQAGANSAESMARNVPPKAFDYYFGDGTLKSFIAKAYLHFWDQGFVDSMDKDTRRKFDKRLADLWVSAIEPIAKTKLRMESIHEDDQQRLVRAGAVDDDHRLPNVHRIIPADRMKRIPYQGQSTVKIYRGVAKGDPNRIIRPGDWVALSKSYAKQHMKPGGRILERAVSAYDVSWAGTDENEWFYTPLRKQVAR